MKSNKRGRRAIDDSEALKNMASLVWIGCSEEYAARQVAPLAGSPGQGKPSQNAIFIYDHVIHRLRRKFRTQKDYLLKQVNGTPSFMGKVILLERPFTQDERMKWRTFTEEWGRKFLEGQNRISGLYSYNKYVASFKPPEVHPLPRDRARSRKNLAQSRRYPFSFQTMREIKKGWLSK